MQPVSCLRLAVAAFYLGDVVLVMREDEVEPTAVKVERLAEDSAAHRRAFDMPARPAFAPRTVPRRLARLSALPEGEIGGRPLSLGHLAPFPLHALEPPAAELAIFGVLADVEVNVAVGGV